MTAASTPPWYQNRRWNRRLGLMASAFSCATAMLILSPGFIVTGGSSGATVAYLILVCGVMAFVAVATLRVYSRCGVWQNETGVTVRGPFRTYQIAGDEIASAEPRQVFVDNYCVRVRLSRGGEGPGRKVTILALPYEDRGILNLETG